MPRRTAAALGGLDRAPCGAILAHCHGRGGCGAAFFWADGPDGRYVALDAEPADDGTWVLTPPARRNTRPARPLAAGEHPPPGTPRYTPHAETHQTRRKNERLPAAIPHPRGGGATASQFRVLVTGSRAWTDTAAITAALDALRDTHGDRLSVLHGACPRGADATADAWCRRMSVRVEPHPADWATGRGAGMARNAAMVATAPDLCLAFILDNSPGATHCAQLAEHAGIPVTRHARITHRPRPGAAAALLAAALDQAAAGRPVFLLGRSKRPVANCPSCKTAEQGHDPAACDCLTCHGFYAATTDPGRIRAMFTAVPGGLLALRTGAPARLVVVDIDPGHGGQVDHALMPPTATVATGGGWHLYYAHPARPVPSRPLPGHPGVDIKADGGYVVLPPSTHPGTGRPYRHVGGRAVVEMPPALLAACLADPPRPQPSLAARPARPAPPTTQPSAGGITSPPALLAALCDTARAAPEGRRRVTLYGSARGVARMVLAGAITADHGRAALTAAGRDAAQTDREIRAAIDGGFTAEGLAA